MDAADRAQSLQEKLAKSDSFIDFNNWTLADKVEALELELSKLRVKNGTSK